MTLEQRVIALAQAIGADIRALQAGGGGGGSSSIKPIRFYTANGALRPVISFITTFRKVDASEVTLPTV